jgi:hypothetical protein
MSNIQISETKFHAVKNLSFSFCYFFQTSSTKNPATWKVIIKGVLTVFQQQRGKSLEILQISERKLSGFCCD